MFLEVFRLKIMDDYFIRSLELSTTILSPKVVRNTRPARKLQHSQEGSRDDPRKPPRTLQNRVYCLTAFITRLGPRNYSKSIKLGPETGPQTLPSITNKTWAFRDGR